MVRLVEQSEEKGDLRPGRGRVKHLDMVPLPLVPHTDNGCVGLPGVAVGTFVIEHDRVTEPVGRIDFNQDDNPTFADFAYLAFTIAVTYGVTDTVLRNRPIRVSVLQHAMVSYLFGTVILAVTVQVIGSLGGL